MDSLGQFIGHNKVHSSPNGARNDPHWPLFHRGNAQSALRERQNTNPET
jgi:hypothetical protein